MPDRPLSERELRFLEALATCDRPVPAGRVFVLAYPERPYLSRRDAGATRTLDALERKGKLVDGTYSYEPGYVGRLGGRVWKITAAGREVLRARH
jgi:hypothetical protein